MYQDPNFFICNEVYEKCFRDWEKKGVILTNPNIMCHVVLFERIENGHNGKKFKIFNKQNPILVYT